MATLAEVVDDLLDNADFEESGSVAKARAFVTAANKYFILQPQSASDQGSAMSMDMASVKGILQRAQDYVSANTAFVSRFSVNTGDFR